MSSSITSVVYAPFKGDSYKVAVRENGALRLHGEAATKAAGERIVRAFKKRLRQGRVPQGTFKVA